MRFVNKRNLSSRYVGQNQILRCIDNASYELELSNDLALVNPIFHVSLLKKCVGYLISIIPLEDLGIKVNISYEEAMIEIYTIKFES